jgi:iron complex outermembrane recepter protein
MPRFLLFAAFAACFAPFAFGRAQQEPVEALDEVIVSVQLRDRKRDETPASVTVLEAETLRAAGQQHLQDVLGLVPNLNWAAGSSRPRYFQLRGIGELDQWQGAPNPSVGFLIDDVDFSGIGTPATMFDIEQVEVLRGPQGVTLGANALAGIISLRSGQPKRDFAAAVQGSVGDFGLSSAGAMVTGPIGASDFARYRVAAQRQRSDGFRRNAFLNRNDTNGFDETTLRAKLRLLPAESLTIDLTAFWFDIDNGYDAFSIDNSRTTQSDTPGRDAQRSLGAASRIDWIGSERFDFRVVTAVARSDIEYAFDGDWGNAGFWGANGPYDFAQRFDRKRDVVSQDLRWASKSSDRELEWVAGLYGSRLIEKSMQRDGFNGEVTRALDSNYRAMNAALYGELTWPVGERSVISFGLRGEHRSARYRDNEGSDFAPNESMWGGSATYRVAVSERMAFYASLSRGYKAGGFNIGAAIPEARREFSAETLESIEVGINGRYLEDRLRVTAAAFFMHRHDQQVETSAQLVPGDPLTFVFFTDNAGRGENLGVEASLEWIPHRALRLGGSLGLLDARFTRYSIGDRDLRDRRQPHAPSYQASIFSQYETAGGWFARADISARDGFFFSASHDERSRPYQLVNLKAGFRGAAFEAELWVRNLFDEYYSQRGFFFGNEPPDFPNKRYLQAGDPRQFGVTLRYHFGER